MHHHLTGSRSRKIPTLRNPNKTPMLMNSKTPEAATLGVTLPFPTA